MIQNKTLDYYVSYEKRKNDETQRKLFSQFEPTTSIITPAKEEKFRYVSVSVEQTIYSYSILYFPTVMHVGCNIVSRFS